MKKWLKIGGIAGIIALVGAAALGAVAFAQGAAGRATFGPPGEGFGGPRSGFRAFHEQGPGFAGDADMGFRGGPHGGPAGFGGKIDREALLAEALGITVEELQAAQEQAQAAAIQQALDEGLITQEEADMMSARMALKSYLDRDVLTAKALGISEAELQAAKDEGKPLPVLMYELEIDPATMRTNMSNAHQEAIDQAVADGVITQEQADELQSGPKGGFGGFHGRGGPGRGGPGGPGGFGGFGWR